MTLWLKYKWHITPFVILLSAIVVSLSILNSDSTKITLSLSILGSGFAIFQFWISEINIKRRREYDLKLSLYNQYIDKINSYRSNLFIKISIDSFVDINNLQYNITNSQLEIILFINSFSFFFKNTEIKTQKKELLLNQMSKINTQISDFKVNDEKHRVNYQSNLISINNKAIKNQSLIIDKLTIFMKDYNNSDINSNFDNLQLTFLKEYSGCYDNYNKLSIKSEEISFNITMYNFQIDFIKDFYSLIEEFDKVEIAYRYCLQESI